MSLPEGTGAAVVDRCFPVARIESRCCSLNESRSGSPGYWPFVLVMVAGAKSQKM